MPPIASSLLPERICQTGSGISNVVEDGFRIMWFMVVLVALISSDASCFHRFLARTQSNSGVYGRSVFYTHLRV